MVNFESCRLENRLDFSISWLEDCDSWLVASACNVNCSDLKINLSVPVVFTGEMNCSDLKIAETVQGWEGSLGEVFRAAVSTFSGGHPKSFVLSKCRTHLVGERDIAPSQRLYFEMAGLVDRGSRMLRAKTLS